MSKKHKGVSSDQAALIHELLCEAFETSLRTQLQSGEFNAAILGKTLEWLKHNNISVVESADDRLQSLANVFRKGWGGDDSYLNFLDEVQSSEVWSYPRFLSLHSEGHRTS